MNTKKDYERAAKIVREFRLHNLEYAATDRCADLIQESFVRFFQDENPRFDEKRFRAACLIGESGWTDPKIKGIK